MLQLSVPDSRLTAKIVIDINHMNQQLNQLRIAIITAISDTNNDNISIGESLL